MSLFAASFRAVACLFTLLAAALLGGCASPSVAKSARDDNLYLYNHSAVPVRVWVQMVRGYEPAGALEVSTVPTRDVVLTDGPWDMPPESTLRLMFARYPEYLAELEAQARTRTGLPLWVWSEPLQPSGPVKPV